MLITKTNNFDVTNKIFEHIEKINNKTKDVEMEGYFDSTLETFSYMIESYVVEIECTENELDFILFDYVKALSHKGNLAVLVFVDSQVSVNTIEKIKVLRKFSNFIQISPTGISDGNKIKIYIGFFNEVFGKEYDVDYIAEILFG